MSTTDKPAVLIVGAGLGGLMLGALLEKSGVPYTIFERAAVVKPLGSAMSVGPTLLPIFQQLGIYDEFLTIGKYLTHTFGYKESLEPHKPQDHRPIEDFTGYGHYIVARPKLYELIAKQVPTHKIHFGKRVLNILEKEDRVTVQTADNRHYDGDIVVGADGAYSAVRQRMYESLKSEGKLPSSDNEELPFSCTCLVGQTKVLDPEQFPILKEPICQFRSVLGEKKPFTWTIFTTAQNTLCWTVVHHLSETTSKAAMEQRFRANENSEWGAYPAQTMCNETRNYPIPLGEGNYTMGDLYDLTEKELISKVMLEEKIFKTWYSGRTVLLGDACHKLNPWGGHGAVTAIHDAIALANLLYAMPTTSSKDVAKVFEEYQTERYPAVMESYNNSQLMSKMYEKGFIGALILFIFSHMPFWLWRFVLAGTVRYRPQVGFIAPIPLMGTVAPFVSPSAEKAKAVYEKREQTAASV
ncbi:hypothetical protein BGX33_011622 [Mortierella sp. NVP41]|nr:hypothetical protein BGX33_011622 [Mortierella sp. NVP41]